MIHLIWSILNLALALYFLYLIVEFLAIGKRIFKSRFKGLSIFIMIIGISQIISATNSEKKTNRIEISENYNKNNISKVKRVILEDNLTFKIDLMVKYSLEQNEYVPMESNSFLYGFAFGYKWELTSIHANNFKPNGKAEFRAYGILKWNLFGIDIYSELKDFKGVLK